MPAKNQESVITTPEQKEISSTAFKNIDLTAQKTPPQNTETTNPAMNNRSSIKLEPSANFLQTPSLIPSLTDLERMVNTPENQEPTAIKGAENEPFSLDTLMQQWAAYAQQAQEKNKLNLYTLLTSNPPELNGSQITVLLENIALESTLNEEKIELLNFLRTQLRNFEIDITAKRTEVSSKKLIYTNKDKYAYMAEKNKTLDEFRKRFNLDIEP